MLFRDNNTPENINDNRQNTIDTRDIGDEGDYTGDNISPQLENDTAANDSSGLLIVDPISNAEDARNQAEEGDLELE